MNDTRGDLQKARESFAARFGNGFSRAWDAVARHARGENGSEDRHRVSVDRVLAQSLPRRQNPEIQKVVGADSRQLAARPAQVQDAQLVRTLLDQGRTLFGVTVMERFLERGMVDRSGNVGFNAPVGFDTKYEMSVQDLARHLNSIDKRLAVAAEAKVIDAAGATRLRGEIVERTFAINVSHNLTPEARLFVQASAPHIRRDVEHAAARLRANERVTPLPAPARPGQLRDVSR